MAIKIYKPYTPSSRNKSSLDFSQLSKIKPERSLTVANHRAKGRNNKVRKYRKEIEKSRCYN